jgi:hypothetical protein
MVKTSSKSSLPPPAPAARKATAKQGVSVSVRVPVPPAPAAKAKVPQASEAQSKAYHAFMDATTGATSETLLLALARQGVTADMLVHRAVVAANYSAHAHPMSPKTPVIRELARLDLKKLAADCTAQMKRQRR